MNPFNLLLADCQDGVAHLPVVEVHSVTVKLQEVKVGMFPSSSVGYCRFFCLRNGVCLEGLCLCTVGKTTSGFVDHCHSHSYPPESD